MPAEKLRWSEPPVHPAAAALPMMSDDELAELGEDIKANGLQHPIVLLRDNYAETEGKPGPHPLYVLDGRNRLAAMKLVGIDDPRRAKNGRIISDTVRILNRYEKRTMMGNKASRDVWVEEVIPMTFVLSANVRRRHLNAKQKRAAIEAFIDADPHASNREIADAIDVSHHTVAGVRKQRNGQNAHSTGHEPRDRARTAWLADPMAEHKAIAKVADVGMTTAQTARKKLVEEGLVPPKNAKQKEGSAMPTSAPTKGPRAVNPVKQAKKAIQDLIKKYGDEAVLAAFDELF